MNYCKVIKAVAGTSVTGSDIWTLTHICGKVERRKRKPGKKAPNKVRCDNYDPRPL